MPSERRTRAQRWAGHAASAAVMAWLLLVVLPDIGDVEGAGELLAARVGAADVAVLGAGSSCTSAPTG